MSKHNDEINIAEFIIPLWKGKILILITAIVFALLGAIYLSTQELPKKQNIVNALFVLSLLIALLPLILAFQLGNEFESSYEHEGFESLIQVSLFGWGLAFVTFLFPYNNRIKKLNRKIKFERKWTSKLK